MKRTLSFILILFLFGISIGVCQVPKKSLYTNFCSEKISIDGKFDEAAWKNVAIASDFVMIQPDNGKPQPKDSRTEVKVLYDNEAIYIAASMYDPEPNKIPRELTKRDDFGTADIFGVSINGFNDGQQYFGFYVSASGVQADDLYTNSNGEDFSWNSIWNSHVDITSFGWTVEMKIPYAALRFSSEKTQTWGLNFFREDKRNRFAYTWNLIDNKISNEATQMGILEGIQNIKTPTRLFFIPYTSFYYKSNPELVTKEFKLGLDIKYGINDAFTLDAILIPDFGQTTFDNVVLNLGPFEQQFMENRPFFTEGTELFSKGDLFYSRRIGGSPSTYPEVADNEEVIKYPKNVNLLNALKVSGRTKDGLGIGVLNAITNRAFATILNTSDQSERQEMVEPLANYNVFVLDQRFRKNSSVSFVNTNVFRESHFRDANVSALVFDLNTKKNTYKLNGDFKYSKVSEDKNIEIKRGINSSLYFAETSGKYRYGFGEQYISKDFDNNDLGINFQTHYHAFFGNGSYRILNPTKTFNSFGIYANLYSEFDNRTDRIQNANINININSTNKKNDYYGGGFSIKPVETYDFYEPRTANEQKFVTIPRFINFWTYISTNYNRKFAIDFNPSFAFVESKGRINYGFEIDPRYRFSNKFSLVYSFNFFRQNKNIGWIDTDADNNIIFARRDRVTYTNTLSGKYSLNNKMNFDLSIRHYWSYAVNHDILTLQDDGSLLSNDAYTTNKNSNFNTWNMDVSYSWWFAPGSQLTILYRNNSLLFERDFDSNFGTNFSNVLNTNLNQIFSISLRYFIDYNAIQNIF
ncbi:DUF5916 domain-containing protein [Flavobacterium aciduliphilum]|uniref:Carbohydrate binding protein with CBM9 domain n=1 Tax=Flavobacterium aciduliphilum TaxID=1101402 RepID=A0A328YBU3_9FLAO|nr:DUF5916 domain-containing protein [Flavobacterium aciduliphilum]RAR71448.1 carbohydrate binding protein with CBM9 domain [Flavobacterium aciduliphilum]